MGLIIETGDDVLGLERRRESYIICDLQRKPYGPGDTRPTPSHPEGGISEHIFADADGEIEVSKDFLNRLLTYFEKHPTEREDLK